MNPLRYDMPTVATLLGVSVKTIGRYIVKGQLMGVYKHGRKRFISTKDLDKQLEKLKKY